MELPVSTKAAMFISSKATGKYIKDETPFLYVTLALSPTLPDDRACPPGWTCFPLGFD